jgi:hypothetical protein
MRHKETSQINPAALSDVKGKIRPKRGPNIVPIKKYPETRRWVRPEIEFWE